MVECVVWYEYVTQVEIVLVVLGLMVAENKIVLGVLGLTVVVRL